jgi:hypothetical protein
MLSLMPVSGALAQAPNPATSASPVPTTSDFKWLEGQWEGHMTGGIGVAHVMFGPPAAGLITGVMRLIDGEKVLVVELISLVDTPPGVEMRFRHFSPALDAYESTFKQSMLLKKHDADADVFENTVAFDAKLMSTQPRVTTWKRVSADTFVGHSDIFGSDGKPAVVEVTYKRVR